MIKRALYERAGIGVSCAVSRLTETRFACPYLEHLQVYTEPRRFPVEHVRIWLMVQTNCAAADVRVKRRFKRDVLHFDRRSAICLKEWCCTVDGEPVFKSEALPHSCGQCRYFVEQLQWRSAELVHYAAITATKCNSRREWTRRWRRRRPGVDTEL